MALASRRILVPTLAAFVAATGVAGAASFGGPTDGRPSSPQPRVTASAVSADGRDFTVRSYLSYDERRVRFNDLPPAGPSFGDSAVGNFDFAGRGDRDGRAHVIQTVTDIDPEYDPGTFDPEQPPAGGDPVRGTVVRATYVFEDGSQITTEGFQAQQGIDVVTRRTFAITGGTGDFRGARAP